MLLNINSQKIQILENISQKTNKVMGNMIDK